MRYGNLATFKRRLLGPTDPFDLSRLAAWSLGYKARTAGKPVTVNPYSAANIGPFGLEWRNGWLLRDEEMRALVSGTRRKPPAGSIG